MFRRRFTFMSLLFGCILLVAACGPATTPDTGSSNIEDENDAVVATNTDNSTEDDANVAGTSATDTAESEDTPSSTVAGADEGGVIFLASTSDPSILNPLLGGDTTSSSVYGRLYPTLFNIDPFTGLLTDEPKQSLAIDWEFSEDGTELIVSLREDAFWNDGTQITAHDYVWSAQALRSGLLDTPRATQMWEVLDDGTRGSGSVVDVVALDDFTLKVEFNRASCTAINDLFSYAVPAHIFEEDFGDDLAAMNDEPLYDPFVSFGAWQLPELIPGDRVSFLSDQTFPDAELGYVSPSELAILTLANSDITLERFRAGEITITGIPSARQTEFEDNPDFQTYRFNRLGYVFFAFNHADPENPQPAYDEDGNLFDQDPHPILGDKMVRQAFTMAVDVDAIIENNLGGNAVRVGIPSIPASFDWNPDLLYPFDPARSEEMLDEAGWIDTDGDGVRECVSCVYLENDPSYEGSEMSLTLNAPDGSTEEGIQMIEFIGQSLRDVGVDAEVNFIDWSSAFLPALNGQTFDMAILAWSLGLPLDPDNRDIFGSENDIPDSGFNAGSYVNPELDQLYRDAVDPEKTDGCTTEGRKVIYDQINEIIFDELPYMFLYSNLSMTGAQQDLGNWQPAPFSRTWQEDAWDTLASE